MGNSAGFVFLTGLPGFFCSLLGFCTPLTFLTPGMISHFLEYGVPQTLVSANHPEGLLKLRLLEDLEEFLIQQVWVGHFWMCISHRCPGDADAAGAADARPISTVLERTLHPGFAVSQQAFLWQSRQLLPRLAPFLCLSSYLRCTFVSSKKQINLIYDWLLLVVSYHHQAPLQFWSNLHWTNTGLLSSLLLAVKSWARNSRRFLHIEKWPSAPYMEHG